MPTFKPVYHEIARIRRVTPAQAEAMCRLESAARYVLLGLLLCLVAFLAWNADPSGGDVALPITFALCSFIHGAIQLGRGLWLRRFVR